MENAPNNLHAMFVEPVVQETVTEPHENEIDSEIVRAFMPMDVDPIVNPLEEDLVVEPWDPYFTVDSFSSLTNPHAFYKVDKVRVDYKWMDKKSNKLYFIVHDKHSEKMAVEVPEDLVPDYQDRHLVNTFVSIHHFQIGFVDPTQFPRYQNYSFVRRDWVILVNSKTVITEILFADEIGFKMQPWLPSIRALATDKTKRKMLIDTVGRVMRGGLKHSGGRTTCELWLRDLTGAEIKFVSYYVLRNKAARLAWALGEQGVLYLARVKLFHTDKMNLLVDTELTSIDFDPDMREARALMAMKI